MTIDLYQMPESGPCRSVCLVAAALGVDLNLKYTNLIKGEHMQPEFLEMNPLHVVPVIDDNGFYLAESRAICQYLADKYAKDDSLYPKDPTKRAVVNQRLFFDMGTFYVNFYDYYVRQMWFGATADPAKLEKIHEALGYVDKFLDGEEYVAGKNLTIADIVMECSIANLRAFDFDSSKYKNVARWSATVQSEVPRYEEIQGEGLKGYKKLVDKLFYKK